MKRTILGITTILATSFALASVALSAQVAGIVDSIDGLSVPGVRICAVDTNGKTLGQSLTAADGRYSINSLPVGQYTFRLDPRATGFQPGDSVEYLSDRGLTVNWKVSPSAQAQDDAVPGIWIGAQLSAGTTTPDWAVPAAGGALGAGIVVGGTLGGLAAGGVIGGSSSSNSSSGVFPITSPSF